MAKSRKVEVTTEVLTSLEELQKAVASLPAGDLKTRAEGALAYLGRTFESQPRLEAGKCPINTTVIRA